MLDVEVIRKARLVVQEMCAEILAPAELVGLA